MRLLAALLVLAVSVITPGTHAAPPAQIGHQGRLLGADGQPLDGSFDITYRIFDGETGGSPLWQETQLIAVDEGLFTARLGSKVPLALTAFGIRPDSLWLEIQVGADPPITPRTQLSATPLAAVSTSVNGDINTSEGKADIDFRDTDDDNDGVLLYDTVDSAGFTVREVDGLGNANTIIGTAHLPGQDTNGQILFERLQSGGDADTSYHLQDRADVTVEKFHVTETFGPSAATRTSSQGADTGSAFVETVAFDSFDSSHAIVQSSLDRSTLKTYYETGDVPVESQFGSLIDAAYMQLEHTGAGGTIVVRSHDDGVISDFVWVQTGGPRRFLTQGATDGGVEHSMFWDTENDLAPQQSSSVDENESKIMLKAAAERAFDAVVSVGPKDPLFPADSIRGTMTFQSISTDLFDTTEVFTIEGAAEGALMRMVGQNKDTTVIIDGYKGGGGGGGRIVVQAGGVNGLGESVKDRFTVSGYGVVGENFVLDGSSSMDYRGGVVMTTDSMALVDSNGVSRAALKKGDRVALIGFGTFTKNGIGSPPDTSFAIDTLGNAHFLGGSPTGGTVEIVADATSTQVIIVDSTGTPAISLVDDGGTNDTTVIIRKGRIEFVDPFGNVVASYAVPGLILTDTPSDTTVTIDSLGNAEFASSVTVGAIEPLATLTVAGEICATGPIGACSDARYKEEVHTIQNSLDRVMQLRGVTYRWRQESYPDHAFDDQQHVGFIAQEVEPLFPEVVMTDDNGYKSVDYSRLTPVLIEAVKAQQTQIEAQNNQITEQQAQIDELTSMVRQLVAAQHAGDATYGLK